MIFPTLDELNTSRELIEVFGGYNHNLRIGDGEFYEMTNLTSSHYPVLSPRDKRGVFATPSSVQGIISKDALCYVDGEDFVINEYRVPLGLSTDPDDCPKKLVSMGAYVIILPDAKWVNTASKTEAFENGSINQINSIDSAEVTITLTKQDGTAYEGFNASPDEPSLPEGETFANGTLWLDTSSSPHTLKQYSEASGMWVAIPTVYVRIEATGIGAGLNQYDGVQISGISANNLATGVIKEQVDALEGTAVVQACDDNSITIIGIIDEEVHLTGVNLTVSRQMPKMDFVIESENRLWGCRYGIANNGEVVNEIYASKLGDFKNWNCFMGISTDSYVASCGTDGAFTGAITHLGYPLFFKENCLHKVFGNYPANYQIQTTACRGVEKGSGDSLAIVNELLYYKGRNGICVYDGSLPSEISHQFGDRKYSNAVAGSHGNKYYVSMKDSLGEYHLFVYDAEKSLWHREDNTKVEAFCSHENNMFFINNGEIKTVFGNSEEDVEWSCESGTLGVSDPDRKYISRVNIRMKLDKDASLTVYAEYDSDGEWHQVTEIYGTSLRAFSVAVMPRRCDHFRLKFVGKGNAKIYTLTKTIEQGSDIG